MSDRNDTHLLQVLSRQAQEDRLVDLVLAECGLVAFETKAPEPIPEVHDGALSPVSVMILQLKRPVQGTLCCATRSMEL